MTRPVNATLGQIKPPDQSQPGFSTPPSQYEDGEVVEFGDVTGGMMQHSSRSKVQANSFRTLLNMRTRGNYVRSREGTGEIGNAPDANRVIKSATFIGEDLQRLTIRITPTTFHTWDGDGWTAFTVVGGFNGNALRATLTEFLGKLYIAFDSHDGIWVADFTLKTVTQVTEAPSARYIVSFGERVIAANLKYPLSGGTFPSAIAAPVNSLPEDWDGDGSYFNDLISESISNEITGLATLERGVVIVRTNSIDFLSRQPFQLAPFRVDTLVTGQGSNLHYTTCRVKGGIIYADQLTNDVYFYRPGSLPVSLTDLGEGNIVKDLLYSDLANATLAEASYDPYEDEYHLGIYTDEDEDVITRRWVCNRAKGRPIWSYDDTPYASTIGVILLPPNPTTINELVPIIDQLVGSIDSLSSRAIPKARLSLGRATGEVLEFSYDYRIDLADYATGAGTGFSRTIESQDLGSIENYRILKEITWDVIVPVTGTIVIYTSKDGITYNFQKILTVTGSSASQKIRLLNHQLYGEKLFWKLGADTDFRILDWWIKVSDAGPK